MDGTQTALRLIAEEREKKSGFLDLGSLELTELPTALFDLVHLRSLNLGSVYWDSQGEIRPSANGYRTNAVRVFPDGFDALVNLLELLVIGNPVSDLGPLKSLTALQTLDCSETEVRDLGPLKSLTALRELDCSQTAVSDLGPLKSLTTLQKLDCKGTQVSDLGPLKALTELKELVCVHTPVSDLGPLKSLIALQALACSETQVTDLGPLKCLTALQDLSFWKTQVSDLDPLKFLTALHRVVCAMTPVRDLGPLKAVTALKWVDCGATLVSELRPLEALTALQVLVCSGTQVRDLGPLKALTELKELSCRATPVSDLGPLKSLTTLQALDCSFTQVSDLGPLVGLTNLVSLNADGCRLDDFPRQLLFADNLADLRLYHAAIPGIPAELLSPAGFTDCLVNLRNHLLDAETGAEEVHETKLVVLGNGRVGKTQICRRLRGLSYDDKVPSTHGITVTAEPWAGGDAGEVLNIWDFGGQDIYHGAHTLFMKTRAVFLIVWHPDFEAAGEQSVDGLQFRSHPLPYWLEYVRTLGRKDCPVVVVQARCERPEQEVRRLPADDTFLQFPSLKPCWYSAKTGRGQGALDDALRDAIAYLGERDGIVTIGSGRASVLQQLEAWRTEDQALPTHERLHRTLSQNEFQRLCEQTGGVRSPESLLAYLHNLGVVFHQPHLFDERIILDQSWALEAVYGVFDRHKAYPLILSRRGRFTQSDLALTAWRDYSDAEQKLFLSLMQSCGMAFACREAEPGLGLEIEYLAPDLLPGKPAVADQLAGRWNEGEPSWRLEYEYPFLHQGLMRALLCDIGERSREAGVYWKFGAWVYEKATGSRAILEQEMADERRGRITLRVQGERHEALALWLRERIEERSRLFGYPELKSIVDEFGARRQLPEHGRLRQPRATSNGPRGLPLQATEADRDGAPGLRAAVEPAFDKPPASFYPPREPLVFVSYAWGDDTPEGRKRAAVVDDLCLALGGQDVKVHRDRDEMRPGELISEFMDRLAEGDLVLAVISDKYLRSEYCMYELFRIWRNCADRPERFVRKVIPLILPDARLNTLADRFKRATYWTKQEKDLKPLLTSDVDAVGTELFRKYKLIGEFARNTSNMLEHLVDKLQPRDFERQSKEGFKEVLGQIGKSPLVDRPDTSAPRNTNG